ncbi:hypothetical protein BGZ57DRAFT_914765 [Hyaloscypha finlandica]|nr:hypothetical protein BGZ57DRAFT_914765 [Hyaloscypha finlandica]
MFAPINSRGTFARSPHVVAVSLVFVAGCVSARFSCYRLLKMLNSRVELGDPLASVGQVNQQDLGSSRRSILIHLGPAPTRPHQNI